MIDRPTVQRILDAADIVDVVSEFVTLRKSGANLRGYVRSIMIPHRLSLSVLPVTTATVSLVAREAVPSVSSWSMSR